MAYCINESQCNVTFKKQNNTHLIYCLILWKPFFELTISLGTVFHIKIIYILYIYFYNTRLFLVNFLQELRIN